MSHTQSFLSISPTFHFLFEADGDKSVLLEWIEQAAAVPRVKDATRRCAIVNLDWERVRAVDLYAVLRSFLPTGGVLRSVAILLSDFGESQQAQEARLGPSIWHANGGTSEVEPSAVEAHGASGAAGAPSMPLGSPQSDSLLRRAPRDALLCETACDAGGCGRGAGR